MCGTTLFYKKKGRTYRCYELAHIYPLNPQPAEVEELKDVELLSVDRNDLDNQIPLCTGCHTRFDKPRHPFGVRRAFPGQARPHWTREATRSNREYPIEDDSSNCRGSRKCQLRRSGRRGSNPRPQSIDAKCKAALPQLIIRKIKRNVTDYYPYVRREFRALEQEYPTKSQLIYSQVRTFYLKQKSLGLPKQEIYQHVVTWFPNITKTDMIEAPEVIAAFFVQNCEVLD